MKKTDKENIRKIREHLGALHQKWRDDPEQDGHCKSNEGYVGVIFRYDNWHECDNKEHYIEKEPELSMVEVYSYLFGPNRLHQYNTTKEALEEVLKWTY